MFTKRFVAGGCALRAAFAADLAVGQVRPEIDPRTVLRQQEGEQLPIDRELPPPDARALMLAPEDSKSVRAPVDAARYLDRQQA